MSGNSRITLASRPTGVDCSSENVGGEIMFAIKHVPNPFSLLALHGLISGYNATEP